MRPCKKSIVCSYLYYAWYLHLTLFQTTRFKNYIVKSSRVYIFPKHDWSILFRSRERILKVDLDSTFKARQIAAHTNIVQEVSLSLHKLGRSWLHRAHAQVKWRSASILYIRILPELTFIFTSFLLTLLVRIFLHTNSCKKFIGVHKLVCKSHDEYFA